MKCLLTFMLVGVVSVTSVFAQDKKQDRKKTDREKTETSQVAWFDLENCEICQSMSKNKGMMEKIKWETHLIPNGFLSVAVIPDDLKDPMKKAKKQMKATMAKLEKGEDIKCCGYCRGLTALMKSGANKKELSTVAGDITLVTSTDEDVVDQLHAHAKKTIKEFKNMKEHMDGHQEQTQTNQPKGKKRNK